MEFPYGRAPLAILIVAVISGLCLMAGNAVSTGGTSGPQDLVYATFTDIHYKEYSKLIPQFAKANHVNIQLQLVDSNALKQRLAAAMEVGADVPDMVEIQDVGYFTKGPLDDVKFYDLTDKLKSTYLDKTGVSLYDQLVHSRFPKWSSRGHIFALPHDVHPMMLCYRRDIVESLGIDVSKLTTWDEFCRVGREVMAKYRLPNGSQGYMLDMPNDGGDILRALILQRGVAMFDTNGSVAFDDPRTVDVICWYAKQIEGPGQIAFPAGWDQSLTQAVNDGLDLFYFCPDWRSKWFEQNLQTQFGKMGMMPFPAWEPGGVRTSTWGGTGLAITKQCKNFDLAWKLAMFLYYDPGQLGPRFKEINILPPLVSAWTLKEYLEPRDFFGGIRLGEEYAKLAAQVPPEPSSPYLQLGTDKMGEAFTNVKDFYKDHYNDPDDTALKKYAAQEVHRVAEQVKEQISRNIFLATGTSGSGVSAAGGNTK